MDGERGGWSWCESCGSALGPLVAADTWLIVVGTGLKGLTLEFCATGMTGVQLGPSWFFEAACESFTTNWL